MASIVKRKNSYCVVYHYSDKGGKKKQKWETFKTLPEAKTRLKEVEYKMQAGVFSVTPCVTVDELLDEYVEMYGRSKWALSTYQGNVSTINHYIRPIIGSIKLADVTPRFLEQYYKQLLKTRPVSHPLTGESRSKYVTTGTVREVHKILNNCFNKAVKWEIMERNPALKADVPKHENMPRDIWSAETFFKAVKLCDDDNLKLSMNLAFACSLRLGEVLGLTWDCVDVSEDSIRKGCASIHINKELQRVSRDALEMVDQRNVMYIFETGKRNTSTVMVLKSPKTKSSIRKVFLPSAVAEMLVEHKEKQDLAKETFGSEYKDNQLVICGVFGAPCEHGTIQKKLYDLIEKHNLPRVVFHSLRHSSITYKLKLNGGDVKSVQGDSGHSQSSMVIDVYSHIMDEGRVRNARLFQEAFYSQEKSGDGVENGVDNCKPSVDTDDLIKLQRLLENPETAAVIKAFLGVLDKGK